MPLFMVRKMIWWLKTIVFRKPQLFPVKIFLDKQYTNVFKETGVLRKNFDGGVRLRFSIGYPWLRKIWSKTYYHVVSLAKNHLANPLKPGVKSRMKMQLEQRQQAMLQLHLSDQRFYCLSRCQLQGATYIRVLALYPNCIYTYYMY